MSTILPHPTMKIPYFLPRGKITDFRELLHKTGVKKYDFFMIIWRGKGRRSPSLRAFWRLRKSPRIDKARPTPPRCACSPPHASAHTAPCSDREFPDMSAKPDGISCSCSVTHRHCTFQGIPLHSRCHSIPLHYGRFHKSDKCNVFHWQIRPVP